MAMEEDLLRQMPYSSEAEMSVLGGVLIDEERMSEVVGLLREEDFYLAENRMVFAAMTELYNMGRHIDLVSLIETMKRQGNYEKAGGREYIARLIDMVPTAANVESYCRVVQEKSGLRQLITAAGEIQRMCLEGGDEARAIMDVAEQKIAAALQGHTSQSMATIKEVILEAYDILHKLSYDKEDVMGVPTGFRDLDSLIVGLNKSDLCLLAARPGMGKTSFALNIAQNVALRTGKSVAIFSLEMSKEQLVNRMLSSEAMVDSYKLRTGELDDEDWTKLARAAGLLSTANIYLDDTSGINALEMKAKCRRIKDLGMVVIDYLQLMQGSRHTDNRVAEVSEISRSLKIMAKELNVPVICLSQLSRGPESRTDKRPMLSDLRESGSIEQDADIVIFLYREDYYDKETEKRNVAECIVSKNRHGSTNKVELQWLGQYTRFSTQEKVYNE
ncbi:MAG: replicative DNA helicase [Eubacteriales bacterium]|jgi:replicative DNA helicase